MPSAGRIEAAAERSELVRAALRLARELHTGEFRDVGNDVPFVTHPVAVAELLIEYRLGEEALAAGLLHDALEYTGLDLDELRRLFGMKVAMIVCALSEDSTIEGRDERKKELRERVFVSGAEARRVFAADKIANVMVVREAYELEGEAVAIDMAAGLDHQILLWEHDMEMLFEMEEGIPLFERLAEELLGLWDQLTSTESARWPD